MGYLIFCYNLNYPFGLNHAFLFGSNINFCSTVRLPTIDFLRTLQTFFVQNRIDNLTYTYICLSLTSPFLLQALHVPSRRGWKSQHCVWLCCLLFLAYPVSKFILFYVKQKPLKCSLHSHSLSCIIVTFSFFSHHFCCCLILSFQSTSLVMSHYYLFQRTAPKVLFIQLPPISVDRESI